MQPLFNRNAVTAYLLLLLTACLSACEWEAPPQPSGEVYSVAYLNVVDNEADAAVDDVLEGVLAANRAEPNLQNGDRVEIVNPTAPVNPERFTEVLAGELDGKQVSALLLGSNSKVLLEIKQDLNALRLPVLAVVATHPEVTEGVEHIAQLSFDDERQGQAAAMFVRDELLVKNAAVIFDGRDPYSSFLGQMFRTTFEQAGGTINGFQIDTEVSEAVLREWKNKDTQFIYMPLGAKQVLDVHARLQALGWQPDTMGADGLLASLQQAFPERTYLVEGMYVTDHFTSSRESVRVARFVNKVLGRLEEQFERQGNSDVALGVEAYRVIYDAINRCQNRRDLECINRMLRAGHPQTGVMTRFSIAPDGKSNRPIYINKIINNELEMIVKVN